MRKTEPDAPFVADRDVYTNHDDKLCAADDPNRVFKVIDAGETMESAEAEARGLPAFIKAAKKNDEADAKIQAPGELEKPAGEDK